MKQLKPVRGVTGVEIIPSEMDDARKNPYDFASKHKIYGIEPKNWAYEINRLQRDWWAADPDGRGMDTLQKRFAGDFEWAAKEMSKQKLPDVVGNVKSLIELELETGLVCGEEIDFDAYSRGDARCLGTWHINEVENGERVLKIAVGVGANCGVGSEEMVRMSLPALGICKAYAEAGYGIELIAFRAAIDKGGPSVVAINCEHAPTMTMVGMMCSTAVFRTFFFHMADFITDHVYDCGYGYPVNHRQNPTRIKEMADFIHDNYGDDTIVIHSGATVSDISRALQMQTRRST